MKTLKLSRGTAGVTRGLLLALLVSGLTACRSADDADSDPPRFPQTPDSDHFAQFLNPAPAVPRDGAATGEIDNLDDFPEAYYNTIDPEGSRDSFLKWRIENGFLEPDGSIADCAAPSCIGTEVRFRDTKDLGYGRHMFLRWDRITGDVAVYVENYQVDAVPGLPYGPLNYEALVEGDREWNFGVNAIEFSAFPATDAGALKFTKFYNFAGDGSRVATAGTLQHFVDLDGRGDKPMPQACIVCHGGAGRTLVYRDDSGSPMLAPTVTGGVPGDVQAQMQQIEFDTLDFSDEPGFREEDAADGVRLINAAVLSTYDYRATNADREGDWDPSFAIEMLSGRYGGDPLDVDATYDENFVPSDWSAADSGLYRRIVAPNCLQCHALRGSRLNTAAQFARFDTLLAHGERVDDLVFERGLMPLGLLNYSNLWDSPNKDPADLAVAIGKPARVGADGRAIRPGAPALKLALPRMATGVDGATGERFPIPVSAGGSEFVERERLVFRVSPPDGAEILPTDRPGEVELVVPLAGPYTVEVAAPDGSSRQADIEVLDRSDPGALPVAGSTRFFGVGGIEEWLQATCSDCHSPDGGYEGIPLHYVPCGSETVNGYEFLYRSVLARVNFDAPLDSLLLRKALNGATDHRAAEATEIAGYHVGGNRLSNAADYSRVLTWILDGAPRGELPTDSIAADAAACVP